MGGVWVKNDSDFWLKQQSKVDGEHCTFHWGTGDTEGRVGFDGKDDMFPFGCG